ncbi:MAG: hypothetical protein EXR20_04910 [Bacteroidetes bacterium]|nr:hypothetical protein [Bacteroidota bacterium]
MNGAEKHAEIIDEYGSYENYLQHIDEYHKTEQKAKEQAKEQEKEQEKIETPIEMPMETPKLEKKNFENNYLVIIMTKTGQTHILNINAIDYANAEKMASLFPTLKEIIQITLFNLPNLT